MNKEKDKQTQELLRLIQQRESRREWKRQQVGLDQKQIDKMIAEEERDQKNLESEL